MKSVQPITVEDHQSNITSIVLSRQAIIDQTRLTFCIYDQKSGLFDNDQYRLITPLISLTMSKPESVRHVSSLVKINFRIDPDYREKNLTFKCAFWNILTTKTAQWSTQGCHMTVQTDDSVTCMCDHLTHFAVLMVWKNKSK